MSLELSGILSAAQLRQTAGHIAGLQQADGLIPWFDGHYADPWDHIEGAMALTACGLTEQAHRAFAWSAEHQYPDGSWPMETVGAAVQEASVDANQCAYIAVGIWHHWLVTGDRALVDDMWPVVRAAIEYVVELQLPGGAIAWSRDAIGVASDYALLTGSACMVLSLRCAMALADLVNDPQLDWEIAAARLAHSVAVHPDSFQDQSRFSMDWYYPVLGGAVRGAAAIELLDRRWDEFVLAGKGIRCVSDRPWITAAETCELVLALDAIGDGARARQLMADVQFLRADDGGYWTGWVWPEDQFWPAEKSSWTGSAIVLATDALSRHTPAHALFRGDQLPRLLEMNECDQNCFAMVGDRND
ncbi:MAG: prenyltransferase [Jatrophihabitantaceae bacterium]